MRKKQGDTKYRIRMNRIKFTTTIIVSLFVGIGVFYACKKNSVSEEMQGKAMMSTSGGIYQQPVQNITVETNVNIGDADYTVKGYAIVGSYDGRIYECSATWKMQSPGTVDNMCEITVTAKLNSEFYDVLTSAKPVMNKYNITITKPEMLTTKDKSRLWERIVQFCNENVVKEIPSPSTHMRSFSSMEALIAEVNLLGSLADEELAMREISMGFMSYGRASNLIYFQIVAPAEENDEGISVEQARIYSSQYPEYLEVLRDEISGEYEFLPKYIMEEFRYVMNADRMFRAGEKVFKVFNGVVLASKTISSLQAITEENVRLTIENIRNGLIADIDIYSDDTDAPLMYGIPPFDPPVHPSRCNIAGELCRYSLETASPIASNKKEKVLGIFKCKTEGLSHEGFGVITAYFNIWAEWKCAKCADISLSWCMCRRHLNVNFNSEIIYQDKNWNTLIVDTTIDGKTKKPQVNFPAIYYYKVFEKTPNEEYLKASLYKLCGQYWIATTYCDLSSYYIPIRRGR